MPSPYPQRALSVLLLFGTLSAAMALLSSSLIFQLPSGRAGAVTGAAAVTGALPEPVAAALLPVSAVLAALCLVLNVSCLLLCLLHGYCSTELCRGQPGPERADWFLLHSSTVRHAALGIFCCGLCLYLTALALSMLLLFDSSAGIAGASILSSGILILLLAITHSLLRASRVSQGIPGNSDPPQSLYENDSAQPGQIGEKNQRFRPEIGREFPEIQREFPEIQREFPEIHREFSFPAFPAGEKEFQREFHRESHRDWMETPRMHRTLSAESGLLQGKNPWNVVGREMRNGMARRAKDSTLV